jgi:hypothetical protein
MTPGEIDTLLKVGLGAGLAGILRIAADFFKARHDRIAAGHKADLDRQAAREKSQLDREAIYEKERRAAYARWVGLIEKARTVALELGATKNPPALKRTFGIMHRLGAAGTHLTLLEKDPEVKDRILELTDRFGGFAVVAHTYTWGELAKEVRAAMETEVYPLLYSKGEERRAAANKWMECKRKRDERDKSRTPRVEQEQRGSALAVEKVTVAGDAQSERGDDLEDGKGTE